MRRHTIVFLIAVAVLLPVAVVRAAVPGPTLAPLPELEREARRRVDATPRVALADTNLDVFKNLAPGIAQQSEQVPNYLRALAVDPNMVAPFARLVRAVHEEGRLDPALKAAMGLRISQVYGSPYVAIHEQRALRRTSRGNALLAALKEGKEQSLTEREKLALSYAELLTRDIHGVKDADFARVSAAFDDSEVVELTLVTCFFNYFVRLSEGLALPVEPWALDAPVATPAADREPATIVPRISLASDAEMEAATKALAAAREQAASANGLGLGIANSQRAMLRSPEISTAWRDFWGAARTKATVERSTMLQVSFAVSMANDCRYCTIHQVLGLRRVGVDIAKLVAMKKDDESLTPRELTAVRFARKLTADPLSGTPADYEALRKEFGERGALDVVMQTANFSFMNRFTDGLRLPSEDEAVHVYREVYGPSAY